MKLSSKASLILTTVMMAIFLPLTGAVDHFLAAALRRAAYEEVESLGRSSALMVSSFVENGQRNTDALAAALSVVATQGRPVDELREHVRRTYEAQGFGHEICLLDPKGGVLLGNSAQAAGLRGSLTFRHAFGRTMAQRRGEMSAPYASRLTGRPELTFTAPVLGADGQVTAVVTSSYDLLHSAVLGGIREQRLGRGGYVYLVDAQRRILLHPDPDRILKQDIQPGVNLLLDRALAGDLGTGATVNSRGVPMLASFQRVEGTPWIVAAQIPGTEVDRTIAEARRLMLAGAGIGLVVLLAVSVLAIQHFTRPIGRLHEAARIVSGALEGGSSGWDAIPALQAIRSHDETGALARTLVGLVRRQHQSLDLLRRAASEWERTFRAVHEAVLCMDVGGRILRLNQAAEDLFRVPGETALGRSGREVVLGAEPDSGFWPEAVLLDASHERAWTSPLPGRVGLFEFRASPILQDGVVTGMILVVRDCTEQVRREEDIRRQAFFDPLTGIPNRILLMDRLQQALAAGLREGREVGLMFLDLDGFKAVNDSLGHQAGDGLLLEVAERLGRLVRKNDTLARLGGDEFVIVLSAIGRVENAQALAERVIQVVGEPIAAEGHSVRVGVSVGIALSPRDGTDAATLLRHADAAMYQAKRGGRNTYRFYAEDGPEA